MLIIKLFVTFLKIGLFTLGSGYSMLVLAQGYIVDKYGWLTLEEFTDVVALSEVTPGPFIVNLATFVGTKMAGLKGALSSTMGLFVIPFIALYIIALKYAQLKNYPVIQGLLNVVRPMAIGLVTVAILRLSRTAIPDIKSAAVFITVVALTYFFKVSPLYIVAGGVILGLVMR